jgi:hypothetical protein
MLRSTEAQAVVQEERNAESGDRLGFDRCDRLAIEQVGTNAVAAVARVWRVETRQDC